MAEIYKKGYILFDIDEGLSISAYNNLKKAKAYCEELIVGLPNDDLVARLHNAPTLSTFLLRKEIISHLSFVSDVVEVDWPNINKFDMWNKIHYDVCFVGSIYGTQFYDDKKLLNEKGAELLLLESETKAASTEALMEAVKEASYTKKIVLFGTGAYFDLYMKSIGDRYKPAFAVDNDKAKWGTKKKDIRIYSPDELKKNSVENILVVVCCKQYTSLLEQLRRLGDYDFRTMIYEPTLALWSEYELLLRTEKIYMEESHRQLKILLKEFDRVCVKYNLRYFLICGSLIGAVRHKDLIPWDDDADVAMTREDYEKLKSLAPEIWNGEEFTFLPYDKLGNSTFLDFLNRLVYQKETIPTNIFYRVKDRMKADVCNHQVLDIYVLDNTSDNSRKHHAFCFRQKILYGLAMGHRGKIDMKLYKNTPFFMRFAVWILSHIGKFLPLSFIFFMYEHHCKKFYKTDCSCYYESNGWINFFEHKIPKELLSETCRLPLGEISVMAPKRYDDFLENHGYHNYMSYPPACVRKPTHSVSAELIL